MSILESCLLPDTATVGSNGALQIGGVSLLDLAREFGTPAFVFDETHILTRCKQAIEAFPDGAAYATKAFLCQEMARLAVNAGMKLDVSTAGELHVALTAGVTASQLVFHGNNKNHAELALAIEVGVHTIVIDSFDEIDRIEDIVEATKSHPVRCLVRVTPGIEAHTHEYILTGNDDSKFGFGLASGEAQRAIDRIGKSSAIDLKGIHAHIGSQIFEASFFEREIEVLAQFIAHQLIAHNEMEEFCIGGGLGVPYVNGESAPSIAHWGAVVRSAVDKAGLGHLRITCEPGRSIIASSAVTLYTVGTIKHLPDIRTYISVDGGMSDNPRPVLYGSGYEAFLPRSPFAERPRNARIVGKHCESGDVLIREASLPADVEVGDVLATPVTGAYGYSMASNYNKLPRPPVIFVKNGDARLVVRRETLEDLVRLDV